MRPARPKLPDLLAQVAGLPRSALPAVLTAVAARLAEPEDVLLAADPRTEPDRLLTVGEAAARLGLDVASVARRRWPFRVKLGRRTVRYRESGLEAWLANGGR